MDKLERFICCLETEQDEKRKSAIINNMYDHVFTNTFNNLTIRWASQSGKLKIVRYLVEIGCDPKADNNSAIKLAYSNDNLETTKYLYEIGCDHKNIKKSIKYEALLDCKNKLLIFMQTVKNNKYLKMEILKMWFPQFSYFMIEKIM